MRLPFAPLAAIAGAACIAGCSITTPSPQLAYCMRLHSLFYRYRPPLRASHGSEIARADYAVYQCQQGHTAEGIATLTELIERHRVAVPPPTAPAPSE